jgi:hypothetical protein
MMEPFENIGELITFISLFSLAWISPLFFIWIDRGISGDR